MSNRGPFIFLVGLLLLAGVSTTVYRHQTYGIPYQPSAEQRVWQVEARVRFTGLGGPTQVFLSLPPEQNGFRIIDRGGPAFGFGVTPSNPGSGQPHVQWSKRAAAGEQSLFYKLELVEDREHVVVAQPPADLRAPPWSDPFDAAAAQVLEEALPLSADAVTLATQIVALMNRQPPDQNINLLLDAYTAPRLLANLLLRAEVPARTVEVLALEDGRRRQELSTYVQVWQAGQWHLFDPALGEVNDRNLLLWLTERPAVLEVMGGRSSRVSFSMIENIRSSLTVATEQHEDFDFSLYSLPIAEQGMFKIIMLLPIGALVVVFMRVIIGFKTSGTFMPVLIALAFLQTELIPGVSSFLLVVTIGLMIRNYLSELNLLLVARIAALVIIVISIITIFSVVSYRLGLIGGLTITFFPMIILAWTIERMSITWEEEGAKEVFVQGSGSLFVAVLAYLAMNIDLVRHLAFNFPELHLVVLAVILLLGRYTGYRVLELHRFAAFRAEQRT